jgi:WD40 repeat protein
VTWPTRAPAAIALALALATASLTTTDTLGQQLDGGDRRAAVDRGVRQQIPNLIRDVEHAHPVAMMFLAKRLFDAGRRDEAVFWFYEGQLRWRALLIETPDPEGQAQFQRLFETIGPAINPYAFRNLPAFYTMIDAVLAWDTAHQDEFVTSSEAKARSRQGLADLVSYTRAHEAEIRARQVEIESASPSDPNDPFSGSGGAMFSTPGEMLAPYDTHRFDELQTGHTTREEVVRRLGGPEWWSTERDGTSIFGYSYAGSSLVGLTRVMPVTLTFDAQRVLSAIHLPSEEPAARAGEPPLPEYVPVRQIDGALGACRAFAHDGALSDARFFNNDSRILTWSFDGTARTWDVETGELGVVLRHSSGVLDAVMSRDEARVITTSYDGTARYWNVANGQQIAPPMRHEGWVRSAIFSRDETVIVTLGYDHTARIWNAQTGAEIGGPLQHESVVWGGILTADGSRLVTWSTGASGWDARTGQRQYLLAPHTTVSGAVFLANESRMATWGYDGAVRIWNTQTGEPIAVMQAEGDIEGAVLSHDEQRLLAWSQTAVTVWDLHDGHTIATFRTGFYSFLGAAFVAGEHRVLTWGMDSNAQIWDVDSGQPLGPAMHSDDQVRGAVMSPDQSRILTWSRDRTARLFDAATGAQVGPSMLHEAGVDEAHFSSNGDRVLTTSSDHFARIWSVSELGRLSSGAGRDQLDWRCQPDRTSRPRTLTVYHNNQ